MEEHKELDKILEEVPGTRRRAAEIMVVPQRRAPGTRQEQTPAGTTRWVTTLKPGPDFRRFTRGIPVL